MRPVTTILSTTALSSTALSAAALGLAAAATVASLGGSAVAAAPGDPGAGSTSREVGRLLECTGTWMQRPVLASVYENRGLVNEVSVQVGEGRREVGAARVQERRFVRHGRVRAVLDLGGRPAELSGTTTRTGVRTAVHEEHDDAGEHVVVDGVHRELDTELALVWRGRGAPLECTGFAFDLQVTRTPA